MQAKELFNELDQLTLNTKLDMIPFIVLDIREESELEFKTLPLRNKNKALLPIIYHPLSKINNSDYYGIPMNKYIIILDTIGLRSRRAAGLLAQDGYLTLYTEGGTDMLLPIIDKYWKA